MTTKKITTPEDYKKASRYNITNYLYNCYENKTEPSMELMANVDFSEIGSKEIDYYSATMGRNSIKVSETLAQNCMSTIPYDAYGKFVTTDWIDFPNDWDGKLVSYAIHSKNISLVEKLHDIGLEKALTDKDFATVYANKCLTNILRPSLLSKQDHLPIENDNFGERYLELLRKATAEIHYFHQKIYRLDEPKSIEYPNNIDWLSKALDVSRSHSKGIPFMNEALVNFASQPQLLPIFADAFNLISKSHPKDIKSIFGLAPVESNEDRHSDYLNMENILSVAFKHNNLAAAQMMVDSFGLTQEDCLKAYEYNLREEFEMLEHNNYDFEEDKSCGISLMVKEFFTKYYKDLKAQFFPDSDTQFLPLFLLTKDTQFKKELLKDKEKLFDLPISQDLTLKGVASSGNSISIGSMYDDEEMDFNDHIVELGDNQFTVNECLYTAKIIETLNKFLTPEDKTLLYPKNNRSQLNKMKLSDFVVDHIMRLEKGLLNSIDASSIPDQCWNKFESNEFKAHIADILLVKEGKKLHQIDFDSFNMLLKTTRLDTQLDEKSNVKQSKLKI